MSRNLNEIFYRLFFHAPCLVNGVGGRLSGNIVLHVRLGEKKGGLEGREGNFANMDFLALGVITLGRGDMVAYYCPS